MTSTVPSLSGDERAAIQERTLRTLFASAIAARASMTVAFTVASLAIKDMLDGARWAGLATVAITIGTAISASWLSSYMALKGRNPGLRMGYAVAVGGALVAAVGVQQQSLVVFLAGLGLFGVGQGATNLARYAAADLAEPANRSKAIGAVVFASTIGAVGGPILVGPAGAVAESVGWNELTGPFVVSAIGFLIAGLVVWVLLRPDPLVISGGLSPATVARSSAEPPAKALGFSGAMAVIWERPLARLALATLVISQAVMVMVMAMTPLHMDAHDHPTSVIGWVISVHTAGMFAFAPVAGWAADRFGRIASIGVGAVILTVSTIVTAVAVDAPNLLMFPGLFLLGLGWSFGMVAGSSLLTESVDAQNRVSAQGAADLATSLASGLGALASGFVFSMAGFHILSIIGTVAAGLLTVFGFVRFRLDEAAAI